MEHPAEGQPAVVADEPEHYPVDDITMRTPCELQYQQRKKIKLVAHGIAEVPVQGGTIHGRPIPEGYARVMVDRVEPGWEDLDLEIPGGNREEELGCTHGSVGTSGTYDCPLGYNSPIHQLPAPSPSSHRQPKEVPV